MGTLYVNEVQSIHNNMPSSGTRKACNCIDLCRATLMSVKLTNVCSTSLGAITKSN